jgi:hypothetical protein
VTLDQLVRSSASSSSNKTNKTKKEAKDAKVAKDGKGGKGDGSETAIGKRPERAPKQQKGKGKVGNQGEDGNSKGKGKGKGKGVGAGQETNGKVEKGGQPVVNPGAPLASEIAITPHPQPPTSTVDISMNVDKEFDEEEMLNAC